MDLRGTLLMYGPVFMFPYFVLCHVRFLHSKSNTDYEKLLLAYSTLCMFITGFLALYTGIEHGWVTV